MWERRFGRRAYQQSGNSSLKLLLYLVSEDWEVGIGETPLLEVDRPTHAAPQGAIVEDLVGTVGAVEDEDGDESKEDHKHC